MRYLVYTALVCRRDVLPDLPPEVLNLDCVCFTDEPERLVASNWQIRPLAQRFSCPQRTARFHKTCPHIHSPGYDAYVWMDAHIVPVVHPAAWVPAQLGTRDIGAFPHRWWNCPYVEVETVARLGLDSPELVARALRALEADAHPREAGLHEAGVLVRLNTPEVWKFSESWWDAILHGSFRDQLHFDRILRAQKLLCADLDPGDVASNPYFRWHPHPQPPSAETRRLLGSWTQTSR